MSTGLDEDELLADTTVPDSNFTSAVDEEELLGCKAVVSEDFESIKSEAEILGEISSETGNKNEVCDTEELDYEEDEEDDKEERTGRFTSERSKNQSPNSQGDEQNKDGATKMPTVQKTWTTGRGSFNQRGRGNWNHGNNQGQFRGMRGQQNFAPMNGSVFGIPSMGGPGLPPPPRMAGGGKILLNPNFVPSQPLVRLNIDGAPTMVVHPPPSMPQRPFVAGGPPPLVVPRLPNGIPLVPLPPNHGAAGFGAPPPARHVGSRGPPFGQQPSGAHWDQAVAAFLNQSPPHSSSHRSRRSSSYSSESSYSSRSSSRSRSSRSRSPRRRSYQSSRARDGRGERSGRGDYRTRGGIRRDDRNRRPRDRRDSKEVRAECAKVVGVDNEYLSKMEEQKRKRDENIRRKEQRRLGSDEKTQTRSSASFDTTNSRTSHSKVSSRDDIGNASIETSKTSRSSKVDNSHEDVSNNLDLKKKAYLCVNVKNLSKLETAKNRVKTLAQELGSLRKCWQVNEDQVNLIFVEHEKAKAFMLKYNNKVLSGLRVQVGLEKAYLNLAEIDDTR